MTPVFVNGKFTAQATTGVQRVATELVRALDRRLAAGAAERRWTLLVPPGGAALPLRHLSTSVIGRRPLQTWEQAHLPGVARSGLLLSLAGSAPAWGRAQACFLHDAAVFDRPQAYSPAFRAWYRFLFARLARRARSLFTVSAFSRLRLAATLGVPEERIHLVPNGADHLSAVAADASVIAGHGLTGRRFLLAVGSANPNKNLAALVRAWRLLDRRDALLVLVGTRNPAVFAPDDVADAPGVLRLGQLDDARLKALYENAAGLVFPSLYEGFGLPPLEAMACGCPVAASNAAALPEVCGDAALYFDPASADAIADAMRALLDDAALGASLRERGLRRAALFRWDDSAAALLGALEGSE